MAMLVPLTFHGRAVGVLVALDRFDCTAPFSAEDERLMRAFAGSAATALATAQTVEEEQLRMSIASADQSAAAGHASFMTRRSRGSARSR